MASTAGRSASHRRQDRRGRSPRGHRTCSAASPRRSARRAVCATTPRRSRTARARRPARRRGRPAPAGEGRLADAGRAAEQHQRSGTSPPPSTRSSSPMPVRSRGGARSARPRGGPDAPRGPAWPRLGRGRGATGRRLLHQGVPRGAAGHRRASAAPRGRSRCRCAGSALAPSVRRAVPGTGRRTRAGPVRNALDTNDAERTHMPTRTGMSQWQGDLQNGDGTLKVGEKSYEGPYSFKSRFEEGEGTNPRSSSARRRPRATPCSSARCSRATATRPTAWTPPPRSSCAWSTRRRPSRRSSSRPRAGSPDRRRDVRRLRQEGQGGVPRLPRLAGVNEITLSSRLTS